MTTLTEVFNKNKNIYYIASDEDGLTYGFKAMPTKSYYNWVSNDGRALRLDGVTGLDEDWANSLVARHEVLGYPKAKQYKIGAK